jgi:hypothetical protein
MTAGKNREFDIEFIEKLQKKAKSVELKNILQQLLANKPLTKRQMETLSELEEKYKNEKGQKEPGSKTVGTVPIFLNRTEVWQFLEKEGWKISKSTLYNHCNEGRLKLNRDGHYTLKAVNRYARTHLELKETGQKIGDEELQRKKTMAEVARITEQAKLAQIKRMAEEGRYIEREQVDLEMAARAATLEAGLKGMVQSRAGEWVALVEGEEKRAGDLVRDMMAVIDQTLNEFATVKEFEVIFKANVEGHEE